MNWFCFPSKLLCWPDCLVCSVKILLEHFSKEQISVDGKMVAIDIYWICIVLFRLHCTHRAPANKGSIGKYLKVHLEREVVPNFYGLM